MVVGVGETITVSFGGCKYCGERDGGVTGFRDHPWMDGLKAKFWSVG